jgi:Fe-S cluster biogenesis protein NfuA
MSDMHAYTASESDRIRRFVLEDDTPILGPDRRRFASPDDARGLPVAEAVLAVAGVQEAIFEGNSVLVLRREEFDWNDLEDRVGYALGAAMAAQAGGDPLVAPGETLDDDRIFQIVDRVLTRDINPAVAQHGGKVELIDVQDRQVVLRMMGGCQGCGMANVTLRQGIEAQLKRVVPGLAGITDITDHKSGKNPYFK